MGPLINPGVAIARNGHCCRCAKCCENVGGQIGMCPSLGVNEHGQPHCTARDSEFYRKHCASFPSRPEDLLSVRDACTYFFDFPKAPQCKT